MGNITKINFTPDQDYIWGIKGLEQWDQGQKLEISGLDISDEIVEVHFSLQEFEGTAKGRLGVVKDGVIHADIPAFILEGPEHIFCNVDTYSAYAWIYVSDDESAETIRKMEFTIKARPEPEKYVKPDELSFLQQLEQAIKNKITTPTSAKVGQLLSVKAVDENGKPTEFDVVDQSKGAEITVDNALSEKSTNPVQNQVVTKEVKALKERNAELEETVEKLQIKTTTSPSPFRHITDSANMKVVDFGMEGKTEQETTSGKNLWNNEIVNDLNNATPNTPYAGYYGFPVYVGSGNKITISYVKNLPSDLSLHAGLFLKSLSSVTWFCNTSQNTYTTEKTFTSAEDYIWIFTREVDVFKQYIGSVLQIEVSPIATTYEPYTNGPSPNPDFPQEIVNAGVYNETTGRYEHRNWVCAKNLVDENGWNVGYMNNSIIGEELSYKNLSIGHYQEIEIPRNTDIYIETLSKDRVSKLRFIYALADENNNVTFYDNDSSPGTWSRLNVNSSNACKLSISILDILPENADIRVNLVSDSDFDGYYHSTNITLTSPVPLTKWDYLTKRDGVWGWSIWSYEDLSDGSDDEAWRVVNRTTSGVIFIKTPKVPGVLGLISCIGTTVSDRFIETNPQGVIGNYVWVKGSAIRVGLLDDTITTLEDFRAFIAEHPFKVLFKTEEEQAFHPLPDEEQELLHNLETYYGVTNLYNDQGCPMWLEYVNDTKLYVDNQIKNAVATTQALILEN